MSTAVRAGNAARSAGASPNAVRCSECTLVRLGGTNVLASSLRSPELVRGDGRRRNVAAHVGACVVRMVVMMRVRTRRRRRHKTRRGGNGKARWCGHQHRRWCTRRRLRRDVRDPEQEPQRERDPPALVSAPWPISPPVAPNPSHASTLPEWRGDGSSLRRLAIVRAPFVPVRSAEVAALARYLCLHGESARFYTSWRREGGALEHRPHAHACFSAARRWPRRHAPAQHAAAETSPWSSLDQRAPARSESRASRRTAPRRAWRR